jgi:hypothetical protein
MQTVMTFHLLLQLGLGDTALRNQPRHLLLELSQHHIIMLGPITLSRHKLLSYLRALHVCGLFKHCQII